MKNLYDVMENISKDEKLFACLKVELNDLKENPINFGASELEIISEYFSADEDFIDDQFELYAWSGDIIL